MPARNAWRGDGEGGGRKKQGGGTGGRIVQACGDFSRWRTEYQVLSTTSACVPLHPLLAVNPAKGRRGFSCAGIMRRCSATSGRSSSTLQSLLRSSACFGDA